MPKAEAALKSAPGVLAVTVDYEKKQATIGTEKGKPLPEEEILAALEKLGYQGEIAARPKNQ